MINPFPPQIKKIGMFALSKEPDAESATRGLETFRSWGIDAYMPLPQEPPFRMLASSDAERVRIFNEMLADQSIGAMMAVRGGYGISRILDDIDWELMQRRNIPIIGYSDVTALHLSAVKHGCPNSICGPMLCSSIGNSSLTADEQTFEMESLRDCLLGKPLDLSEKCRILKAGKLEGAIIPANLTILCSLIGTPHMPDLKGTILVIEDVGEAAYRIDRMLTQLKSSGILARLSGLVFGAFTDTENEEFLPEIQREFAEYVNGPVLSELQFGHLHPSISIRANSQI